MMEMRIPHILMKIPIEMCKIELFEQFLVIKMIITVSVSRDYCST